MSKQGGRRVVRSKGFGLGELTGSRMIPYLVPWLLCALAMPVALLARWRWGDDPRMTMIMGAGAMFLSGMTYVTWARRHRHTRNVATMIAGLVLGWVTFAASGDPLSHGTVDAWIMITVLASVSWDIRYASWSVPHEEDKSGDGTDPLFDHVTSLGGARTKKIKTTGDRTEAQIKLKPGDHTLSEVQGDRERIAQIVGMGTEDVTVSGVPGHADTITMTFQFANGLRRSIYWTGPSLPGGSVYDAPLRPGIRSDGRDLALWVCGDASVDPVRQLTHCLATGVTGAGKTETVKTVILDGRWRRDFVPVVGDPAKFNQSFGEIKEALALYADGPEQCARLVRNLKDAIMYRAQIFGELTRSDGTQGYSQWEPELWTLHGIPLIFIDLEEAADLIESDLDDPVRKARSVGIFLWVSLQTAIFQNLERKTRGQFGQSACHGMNEMQDAKFGLNANTINAGADPTKWGADSAGSFYAEFTGTPKNEWPTDARAYAWGRNESESRQARRAEWQASQKAGTWAVLDPGTAGYLSRGLSVPGDSNATHDPWVTDRDKVTARDTPAPVAEDNDQTTKIGSRTEMTQELAPPAHDVVFSLGVPQDKMTTEQARKIVEDRIDELEARDQDMVGYQDIADLAAKCGRKRAWLYKELTRLVEAGRLEEGVKPPYRIRPRIANGHRVPVA